MSKLPLLHVLPVFPEGPHNENKLYPCDRIVFFDVIASKAYRNRTHVISYVHARLYHQSSIYVDIPWTSLGHTGHTYI